VLLCRRITQLSMLSQKLIKTYVSFYSLFLGATWGYSIIYIIMLFKSHQESVTSCQQVSQDLKSCEKSVTVSRTSVVVSTVLSLLLQTCEWDACSVSPDTITYPRS
jgi:hypothetical protein